MNCSVHPDVVAVATCQNCGVGMCSDCVNSTEYTFDNKPLCRSCNKTFVKQLLKEDKSKVTWTTVKLVLNAICVVLGAIIWFDGNPPSAVFVLAIGGIPTAWKLLSTTPEERLNNAVKDAVDDHYSPGSSLGNSAFRFFFRIIFTIIIGAIAAPILLIINVVKLVKANKRIKYNEALLANF